MFKSLLTFHLALLLIPGFLHAADPASKDKNLFKNGDFSEGLRGWKIESWAKTGAHKLDEDVRYNNKPTLLLENTKPDNNMANQTIRLEPNTRYRMTAFVKAENVEYREKGKDGACMGIRGTYERSQTIPKTTDWRKVTFDFNSGNRREIEIGPHLGWHASVVTGKAWFAEIVLEKR